jgi:hypothetical protein
MKFRAGDYRSIAVLIAYIAGAIIFTPLSILVFICALVFVHIKQEV